MKLSLLITTAFAALLSCCAKAQSFTTLNTGVTLELKSISFADTNTGFACGDSGVVLKTTNGGAAWTRLTTGTKKPLWDIKVVPNSNGQQVIALGDDGTIIKSTNAGTSWTAQISGLPAGSFLFSVQCIDAMNYYASGGSLGYNAYRGYTKDH